MHRQRDGLLSVRAQIRTAQVSTRAQRSCERQTALRRAAGREGLKGSWMRAHGDGRSSTCSRSAFTWNYLAYMVLHDPKLDIVSCERTSI